VDGFFVKTEAPLGGAIPWWGRCSNLYGGTETTAM